VLLLLSAVVAPPARLCAPHSLVSPPVSVVVCREAARRLIHYLYQPAARIDKSHNRIIHPWQLISFGLWLLNEKVCKPEDSRQRAALLAKQGLSQAGRQTVNVEPELSWSQYDKDSQGFGDKQ
jgi:hypothetical protein